MSETITCPAHGEKPLVRSIADPLFVQCRGCWYRDWLIACLTYGRRRRRGNG